MTKEIKDVKDVEGYRLEKKLGKLIELIEKEIALLERQIELLEKL